MNLDDFLFACCVSFEAAKQAKSQAKKRRKSQKAIIVQKRENGGVAVIGAGAAGLVAARHLLRCGLRASASLRAAGPRAGAWAAAAARGGNKDRPNGAIAPPRRKIGREANSCPVNKSME